MAKDQKQMCTIRIMFPVSSDEEAIVYKKNITEALKDVPDVHMQFILVGTPDGMELRHPNNRPVG